MKKHIDDIFKDQFDQFEAPVSDGLWDKIQQNPGWQQHLRRQKIRNLSVYAVLAVIVISSCAVLLHQRNISDNQDIDTFSVEEEELAVSSQETADIQPANNDAMPEISADETIVPADPVLEATDTPSAQNDTETMIPAEDNSAVINPANTEPPVPQNNSASEKSSEKNTINNKNNSNNNNSTQTSESNNKSNSTPGGNESPTTPSGTSENANPNSSLFSIPNAFTPNGDGLNDVFKPVTSAEIQQYQLDIFAMSGQHIFTSRNLEYGWNGEFQGGAMNSGNYIYVIKYKETNGREHIDKGQLLLIR
ncbi:MAG: gliding motility-associated C-terminal domain-containing protein [Bacteroidales bacterium]|nr:gliding motility-associated C-terminal domain-containing protein [Bacteroidales bacterium]